MRSLRGLYVIRGGVGVPSLAAAARAEGGDELDADAPADGRLGTLDVDFSMFDAWYEIDSWWEGRFLERTRKGSFKRTIERARRDDGTYSTKVLFNHGFDFHIGDKMLGVPEVLEERDTSPHLEAGLLDTSYNRDLAPGLRAGAYGSSFMFEVLGESWDREPEASDHNPEGLPERTITEVRLYEAGPVTWPANPEATSGLRSGMDWYADQLQRRDPDRHDELVRSFAAFRTFHGLGTPDRVAPPRVSEPETSAPDDQSARHVDGVTAAARSRRLALIDMARR